MRMMLDEYTQYDDFVEKFKPKKMDQSARGIIDL